MRQLNSGMTKEWSGMLIGEALYDISFLLQQMQVDHSEQEQPKGELPKEQQEQQHKTLNHHSLYYSFIQRYFTTYQKHHQYLHRHSNGLYLIRVRVDQLPSPPIGINDVLKIAEVRGKKKRGGSRVMRNTVIMEVRCEKGETVPILAMVDGVVLQKNTRISLQNLHLPIGYVAVINPTRKYRPDLSEFQQLLLPHQKGG